MTAANGWLWWKEKKKTLQGQSLTSAQWLLFSRFYCMTQAATVMNSSTVQCSPFPHTMILLLMGSQYSFSVHWPEPFHFGHEQHFSSLPHASASRSENHMDKLILQTLSTWTHMSSSICRPVTVLHTKMQNFFLLFQPFQSHSRPIILSKHVFLEREPAERSEIRRLTLEDRQWSIVKQRWGSKAHLSGSVTHWDFPGPVWWKLTLLSEIKISCPTPHTHTHCLNMMFCIYSCHVNRMQHTGLENHRRNNGMVRDEVHSTREGQAVAWLGLHMYSYMDHCMWAMARGHQPL